MKRLLASLAAALSLAAYAGVNSPDPEGYRTRGRLMYDDSNYAGCLDQMRHAKEMGQQDDDAVCETDFYIAMASARLGSADAPALLKRFLGRWPQSEHCDAVRLTIADLLLDAGRWDEAIHAYADVNPEGLGLEDSQGLRYNSAYALLRSGRLDDALPLYRSLAGSKAYGTGARFYEGYIAYAQGNYSRAATLLKGCDTSKTPGNMADFYLCQIYYHDGDYRQAAASALKLMKRDGIDDTYIIEATRIAGESLYHTGDDARAIELLRRYIAAVSTPQPSALYILGVADYRSGLYADAVKRLTPVGALDNAMGQSANLYIGQALMQQGDYSAAMLAFDRAIKSDFDNEVTETAFYNYAVASTQGGRIPFGSSVATFEEFVRRFPESRYADEVNGYIVSGYMTDNNYPAALAAIDAVRRPSPQLLKAKQQVLYTLGVRDLRSGDAASAANRLTEASRLAANDPQLGAETLLWLGEALYADGRYDEAVKRYGEYLASRSALRSNLPIARFGLAYSLFSQADYEKALPAFHSFISEPGSSPSEMLADAYVRVADCHFMATDFTDAADNYAKAYSLNPASGDYSLYQQAIMEGFQRRHSAKAEGLRNMIQRFPASGLVPQALIELGESYQQLGQPEKAIETYSLAATRYPATAQGRQGSLLLALAYLNQGQRARSINTYKRLISDYPTSDEAATAMEHLKNIMAQDGNISQYAEFLESVPGAKRLDPSEIETLTFTSAERDFLDSGRYERLASYADKYPSGASRPVALSYLVKATAVAGDVDSLEKYATALVDEYPDSPYTPEALLTRADHRLAQGKAVTALNDYSRLEESASSPYMLNVARIGVIRAARDLGQNDRIIDAADALTASSTLSAEQRAEARFSRARARADKGENAEAEAEWLDLARDLSSVYGAKAALAAAQLNFDAGNIDKARTQVMTLVDSDTPHNYWLARGFILLSDIYRAEGHTFEADQYLISLRDNYPGTENDIFSMISERLSNR